MKITLLLTESCTHRDDARALVDAAIVETAIDADLEVITVRTDEEARQAKVLGSPSIRVDGRDIEYGEQEPAETQPGCRYYNSPAGWMPIPEKGLLVRAIEGARDRE